jgi:hypothetical protein
MKTISEIFDEIRPQAEAAFWLAFELEGYGREFLNAPPVGENGKAWALAKTKAWRVADAKTEQLFQQHGVRNHPEILCDHNDRNGVECPF